MQGGEVLLSYELADAQEDHASVLLEYSTDNGATWQGGTVGASGDGATPLASTSAGTAHTISWWAQVDVEGLVSNNVKVRLTPIDTLAGNTLESSSFSVNLIPPRVDTFTLGSIPDSMNGRESFTSGGGVVDFHFYVPNSGFTLTVDCRTAAGGNLLDLSTLTVTANQPLGDWAAGTELADQFTFDGNVAQWTIPSDRPLPFGDVVFTSAIGDVLGNLSPLQEFDLRVIPAGPAERPFDQVDTWWIDFGIDQFSTSFASTSTVSVTSTLGGNGKADYLEDLEILGLQGTDGSPQTSELNGVVREWVMTETVGRLRELFGGSFDGTTPGYNPRLQFTRTPGGHRSAIRVGGGDDVPGFTIGRAQFDYRNGSGNINVSPTLGIFVTNLIEFYINTSFTFRDRFDPLIPNRGAPIGQDAMDSVVLHPDFERFSPANTLDENRRYDDIASAVDALARSVSVILAHEIGHSIGLVANGVPPAGLFGGVTDAPFSSVYTNSFHLDVVGNNIMASALSFSSSLSAGSTRYSFNELTREYLRENVLLGN